MISGYLNFTLATLLISSLPAWAGTPPTGRWEPMLELWDEFNGTQLDAKKWTDTQLNPYEPEAPPVMTLPANAKLENGELNLYTKRETPPRAPPGFTVTTSAISAKNMVQYGYFEVRAKVQKSKADNAFWLYRWTETGTFEIDIFEIADASPGHESIIHTNAHVYYGPSNLETDKNRRSEPQVWKAPVPLSDDYHLYGLEWNEKEIKWYFDDKLIRTKANTDWNIPMKLILGPGIDVKWMGMPESRELPAALKVDYLRAWRKVAAKEQPAQPVTTK